MAGKEGFLKKIFSVKRTKTYRHLQRELQGMPEGSRAIEFLYSPKEQGRIELTEKGLTLSIKRTNRTGEEEKWMPQALDKRTLKIVVGKRT